MNELTPTFAIIALMLGTAIFHMATRRFDPFAPVWLFFVGYVQIYVVQAFAYHDWAVRVRGAELVGEANLRAFWGLAWFLLVYHLAPARVVVKVLPRPPARWEVFPIAVLSPVLISWGLLSAGMISTGGGEVTAETAFIQSFPLFMVVAGVLLLVTGRQPSRPRPAFQAAGIGVILGYMVIWMFNGKRSHSLIAVLVGLSAFYLPRGRRPSYPVLLATALAGAMAVGIAINWRYYSYKNPGRADFASFADFVSSFDPATVLESLNVHDEGSNPAMLTHETEEYGAYLLMMATVPERSDYDFGLPYLRVFTTFIPRLVWADKPLPGRDQWIAAWMAGSELKREANFTGPAIGILGAAQLNGGAWGTILVLGIWAVIVRTAYDYAMTHAGNPWAQAFWSMTYYNAWFSTVCDDPLNWFYYSYGFTTLPTMILLWGINRLAGPPRAALA